jgi:hypothetical protein
MPEILSESAYYTGEDERQRKILKYRTTVWELFQEQVAITDDMRSDPPYRENLRLLRRLAGALIVKLHDDTALETLLEQVKEHYPVSMHATVTKALETLFEESCRAVEDHDSQVRSYIRRVQAQRKLIDERQVGGQ